MSDECLHEKARAVIRAGKLPNRRPDRTWGGPGVGADCAICDAPVTHEEVEFEIEFARNGDRPGPDAYHVHVSCYAAWEFERHKLELARGDFRWGPAPIDDPACMADGPPEPN
jgi:hypothetical protein